MRAQASRDWAGVAGPQRFGRRLPRTVRLYLLLVLIAVLFASGLGTGFDLAVKLNYALILLIAISWIWSRWGFERISASVERPATEASVGDTISELITLENNGGPPKSWVEVEDQTTIPGLHIAEVVSLPGLVTFRRFKIDFQLRQRGEYTLGPLIVRAADPFGLFPYEARYADKQDMLVYPRVVDLPDYASPSALLAGDTTRRRRSYILSPEVSSVRDYSAGDAISRIHWRSTARSGKLMVKTFDQGRANEMWVVLDQQAETAMGEGADSSDETAATIAASTVHKYLGLQLPVGFASVGSESTVLAPERGPGQRSLVFRHLAKSRPEGEQPLFSLLAEIEREVGRGSSIVAITSAPDGEWVDALGALQKRGVQAVVVLLDRSSWDPGLEEETTRARLVAYGVRTYVVRRGLSPAAALVEPELPGLLDRIQSVGEAAG